MLEYLLEREVDAVVKLVDAVKRGEDKEKVVELLRILQGDLMTLKSICSRMKVKCEQCKK